MDETMTNDPKRLPMIYVSLNEDGTLYQFDGTIPASVVKCGFTGVDQATYVPEPAHCATCPEFRESAIPDERCRSQLGLRAANNDGSGYCHNHPDNQRAKGE
jgi:hypothetical protein